MKRKIKSLRTCACYQLLDRPLLIFVLQSMFYTFIVPARVYDSQNINGSLAQGMNKRKRKGDFQCICAYHRLLASCQSRSVLAIIWSYIPTVPVLSFSRYLENNFHPLDYVCGLHTNSVEYTHEFTKGKLFSYS